MKLLKALLILVSVLVVMVVVAVAMMFSLLNARPLGALNEIPTPTSEQVNEAAARLILSGRATELYAFYAWEVGDPVKASLYVFAALTNRVPVDKLMSIGWYEGGHRVGGVDGPNANGSYDVRPMGLNTLTYKMYTVSELKALEMNIPESAAHLARAKDKWNVSWEAALTVYNHGSPVGLDQRHIEYVVAVIHHEWELDRRMAARFPELF